MDAITIQVKYFGHINRNDLLVKSIVKSKIKGRQARGRGNYKWEDNIK